MEEQRRYFIVNHPVERTAPLKDKVTLVKVVDDTITEVIPEREGLIQLEEGRPKIICPLLKNFKIDQVCVETYALWYRALTR